MSDQTCPASLNIKGEHFPCDQLANHPGLAHSSRAAEAIWHEDPASLQEAWASAEAAGR